MVKELVSVTPKPPEIMGTVRKGEGPYYYV